MFIGGTLFGHLMPMPQQPFHRTSLVLGPFRNGAGEQEKIIRAIEWRSAYRGRCHPAPSTTVQTDRKLYSNSIANKRRLWILIYNRRRCRIARNY